MNTTAEAVSEFLPVAAIAEILNMDVRAFRRLRRNPTLQFPLPFVFGTSQRWKASEVRTWIEKQRAHA